ncbi:hypothetical protein [Lonepinella sp. BR2271]|uniref:hypothetical protein n=1 Tax=Lonepinella sp. BR2271 TaxID=3434550 RepID=UPI003F6DD2A2
MNLKHIALSVGLSSLLLSACTVATNTDRAVTGNQHGTVAIFTDNSINHDVVVSIDGRFLAALEQNNRVEQQVCKGNHEVEVAIADGYGAKIVKTNSSVAVDTATANYIKVSKLNNKLVLTPASDSEFNQASNVKNRKLVSRMSDALIHCE